VNLLQKIAKKLWNALKYIGPLSATVGQVIPGPDPFEAVGNVILAAEAIGEIVKRQGGNKLDKMQEVLPQAMAIVKATEFVSKHEILDEERFEQGVRQLVEAELTIVRSLKGKD